MLCQPETDARVAVAFVSSQCERATARTAPLQARHADCIDDIFEHCRFVLLTRGHVNRQWSAVAVDNYVDLGSPAAARPAERVVGWLFFRAIFFWAPAAARPALTEEPSTQNRFQSISPDASKCI